MYIVLLFCIDSNSIKNHLTFTLWVKIAHIAYAMMN